MALPFFKKGKDKLPEPAPKKAAGLARPVDSRSTETMLTMEMGASGIVVEETSGAPQSPVDEAAILYASNQVDMAERMLKDIVAAGDRRGWHMLFDLYAIQNREKEFEQLALDYAVRFETSPPVWQKTNGNGNGSGKTQLEQAESLELPGLLDKKAAATLRAAIDATDKKAVVGINFSRIEMVDESGADECAKILSAARKAKRKLRVSGVDRLIALLLDLNRATHSRAVHWLLLLELYQILGQQEAFEDLAVDYAVRFEVSPPSWSEVQAAVVVPSAPVEPSDDALQLSGEITPVNDSMLQQFSSYAATHEEVLVDFSKVTRVDYGSVSQLISVLMHCLGSGKSITLRGHNALIHELFRVMGIDQLAQLVPRHPG
ncbi:MAG: STAS domain-containing protein [Thiobacillus sp.]|nr:STAS domain-containing protein [Thiobacillus sp.]